jgi:hypothetical protein
VWQALAPATFDAVLLRTAARRVELPPAKAAHYHTLLVVALRFQLVVDLG